MSRGPGRSFLRALGKKLAYGLVLAGLVCSAGGGCRSARLADRTADPSAQNQAITSRKSASEASPITWNAVNSSYQGVADYLCVYEKEERVISNGEKQTIRLSFRKPLDVRLEWLNEQGKIDQTAVYRH